MNFTTKHESDVTGIRRSVAKRPRRLWIVVSTLLQIPPCQGSEHDFHIKWMVSISRLLETVIKYGHNTGHPNSLLIYHDFVFQISEYPQSFLTI